MKKFTAFTLAEVFYPAEQSKKTAFTLAEVLITLGIIGVVAAITMPTLIQNYQKQVLVTQLKKSYSIWSQAFQKIMADESIDRLSNSEIFSNLTDDCYSYSTEPECKNTINNLSKYISITLSKDTIDQPFFSLGKDEDKFSTNPIYVSDGSIIRSIKLESPQNVSKNYFGELIIDVNGDKKPNTLGKDIFFFIISNNGKLYPYFGKEYEQNYGFYWKDTESCSPGKSGNLNGMGCAARIMENNWKMDY